MHSAIYSNTVCIDASPPPQPIVTITDIGSHWVKMGWTSSCRNSMSNFLIEYTDVNNKQIYYSNQVYESTANRLYTTLLTDLQPGKQYNVQVVATNVGGTNRSELIEFVTNETGIATLCLDNFWFRLSPLRASAQFILSSITRWYPPLYLVTT